MNDRMPVPMEAMAIMPVMDLQVAAQRRQALVGFMKSIMIEGVDYGKIPGTTKDTLLKPGAEKLTTFFGITPIFGDPIKEVADWTGEDHGGEPFFFYQYRCSLYRGDMIVGQGIGSCNSWEKKYRYRTAELLCPDCELPNIRRSKMPPVGVPQEEPGWYCWIKTGGCGANYPADYRLITEQEVGQIPNPDPADLVNTIDKMAQKRALVAATLIAVNASEFFTQDVEDMNFGPVINEHITTVEVYPDGSSDEIPDDSPPSDNGNEPDLTAACDEERVKKWRDRAAKNKKPTVGFIASILANACPDRFGHEKHAVNWIHKNSDFKNNEPLDTDTALEILDKATEDALAAVKGEKE